LESQRNSIGVTEETAGRYTQVHAGTGKSVFFGFLVGYYRFFGVASLWPGSPTPQMGGKRKKVSKKEVNIARKLARSGIISRGKAGKTA
jgi:hypothetical protein